MKVLLLGGYGFLGYYLNQEYTKIGWSVFNQSRDKGSLQYDCLNYEDLANLLITIKPDIIVNLIAITDVDRCECFYEECNNVNKYIPKNLSDLLINLDYKCQLIQISTDQVYSNQGLSSEKDAAPINNYGLSKLAGEKSISYNNTTILRTNFIGRNVVKNKGLTDWIYQTLISGGNIKGFTNVLFSPLNVESLSKLIIKISKDRIFGTFNLGSNNGDSKFYFASEIAKGLDLNTKLVEKFKYISEINNKKAARPLDMRMNNELFENASGYKLPSFNEEIYKTIKMFKGKK